MFKKLLLFIFFILLIFNNSFALTPQEQQQIINQQKIIQQQQEQQRQQEINQQQIDETERITGDPVSGLASPTLKDNLFTIMYNAVKGKVSIRDHFEDNAYYDKYFGKTNLVNRQLINQSRGITNSFENINNQRTQYVMPYANQNNKK